MPKKKPEKKLNKIDEESDEVQKKISHLSPTIGKRENFEPT